MTENEAIKKIQYRINTASEIVGEGADGKAFEDLEMAIQALEEIQQYRAIGTTEEVECLLYYHNGMLHDLGDAVSELEQYRAIGTVRQVQDFIADWRKYREFGTLEDIQTMKDNGSFSGVELAQIATMQMKLKDYEAIGTVEELQEAKMQYDDIHSVAEKTALIGLSDYATAKEAVITEVKRSLDYSLKEYQKIGTIEELQKAINFKKYFMNLREEGLEVANWHKNGDLEPLVNFIDEACNWLEMKGEEYE